MPVASGFSFSAPPESLQTRSAGPLRPSGRRIDPPADRRAASRAAVCCPKDRETGSRHSRQAIAPGHPSRRSARPGPAKAAGRSRKTVAASSWPALMPGALVWTGPDSAEDRLPQLSHSCIHCVLPAASGNPESDRPKCPAGCASPKDCSDFAGSRLRDPAFFLRAVRCGERKGQTGQCPTRPGQKGQAGGPSAACLSSFRERSFNARIGSNPEPPAPSHGLTPRGASCSSRRSP